MVMCVMCRLLCCCFLVLVSSRPRLALLCSTLRVPLPAPPLLCLLLSPLGLASSRFSFLPSVASFARRPRPRFALRFLFLLFPLARLPCLPLPRPWFRSTFVCLPSSACVVLQGKTKTTKATKEVKAKLSKTIGKTKQIKQTQTSGSLSVGSLGLAPRPPTLRPLRCRPDSRLTCMHVCMYVCR